MKSWIIAVLILLTFGAWYALDINRGDTDSDLQTAANKTQAGASNEHQEPEPASTPPIDTASRSAMRRKDKTAATEQSQQRDSNKLSDSIEQADAAARSAFAAGRSSADPDSQQPATGNGSITGRVIDDDGFALPAAIVSAQAADSGQASIAQEVMADNDGWFALTGLADAEYIVMARDAASGNSSQAVRLAAGTEIVDLVVPVARPLVLFGSVTEFNGEPVASANVRLLPAGVSTRTDDLGVYLLEAEIKRDLDQLLVIEKQGYRSEREPLPRQRWRKQTELQLDVQMRPEAETTTVAGIVRDDEGNALAGQNMQLNNAAYRYKTETNQSGQFLFPDVAVGNNYHLYVLTDKAYERHQQSGLQVPTDGISNLQITVNKRGIGEVSGAFVSATGKQLARLNSQLLVASSSMLINTDSNGRFKLDEVPAGNISLSLIADGRMVTSGPRLEAGESLHIDAIVDLGEQSFVGRVVDQTDEPVGGAKILWRWELRQNGLLHESMRNAVTDSNGRFALSGFAPVAHELRITAAGYAPLQTTVPAAQAEGEFTLQ